MGRITLTFVIMILLHVVYLTDLAICMDEKDDNKRGTDSSASESGVLISTSGKDESTKASQLNSRGAGDNNAIVEFISTSYSVLENEGKVQIGLRRYGNANIPCTVHIDLELYNPDNTKQKTVGTFYIPIHVKTVIVTSHLETISGIAFAGEDYKTFSENVTLSKDEELRHIYIDIVDDLEWETDEYFFVYMATKTMEDGSQEHKAFGSESVCQITIIDDDDPESDNLGVGQSGFAVTGTIQMTSKNVKTSSG